MSVLEEVADLILNDEEKFPLLSARTEGFSHVPVTKECWHETYLNATKDK